MKQEEIILNTDESIIEYKINIEGWVGKDGRFYGKEKDLAIYANSTHKKCEKGHVYTKHWISCPNCREEELPEKYLRLEFKEWDGETPLVIYDTDEYFFDEGAIADYCYENECEPKDLKLVICIPQYLSQICESYWEDVLPEDWSVKDVSKEVAEKLKELNEAIGKARVASWIAGKYRTTVDFKLEE